MTDDVTIREARLDDAAIIAQFNCALSRETEDGELDLETVTRGVSRFLQGAAAGIARPFEEFRWVTVTGPSVLTRYSHRISS